MSFVVQAAGQEISLRSIQQEGKDCGERRAPLLFDLISDVVDELGPLHQGELLQGMDVAAHQRLPLDDADAVVDVDEVLDEPPQALTLLWDVAPATLAREQGKEFADEVRGASEVIGVVEGVEDFIVEAELGRRAVSYLERSVR